MSVIIGAIASSKGRSGFGWFFISCLVSPLIALIILLIVGDSDEKKAENIKLAMEVIEEKKREDAQTNSETMTQEQAIAELKKLKDLLDLQVISQDEYDTKKNELKPFLLSGTPA